MRKLLLGLIGLLFAIPVFATCPSGQVEQTYTSATGTVVQNGTPTPTNPIEPIFYTQGNMVLRKINDTYADSYDATTDKITRRVGYVELDGTETWGRFDQTMDVIYGSVLSGANTNTRRALSNALYFNSSHQSTSALTTNEFFKGDNNAPNRIYINLGTYTDTTIADWKTYLAEQYAAGTPVTVWYPLATAVEEDWTETSYCQSPIKIATTAYNSARFSPVVTELNDTIATIRDVVTNTINQTKAIADLQATKQTRPDENCPAGKKCLLVEDNDGTPHWYEIIENAYGLPNGYTALEYIESTGTQYIDTGATYKSSRIYNVDFQYVVYPDGAKGSLGARQTSTAGTGTFDIGCNQIKFYFYNNSTSANVKEPRDLARHTVEIDYTNSVFKFDGETLPWTTGTGAWQGTYNIYIGRENMAGSPNSDTGTVKWYSYKVYDNGVLIQNLIPAKNSSGVIGMYDTVNGQFYTNQGTGTFTAGPEI